MNRVYKTIWSKTRGMYIVVSELARSHRGTVSGVARNTLLAACVLAAVGGLALQAEAAETFITKEAFTKLSPTEQANYQIMDGWDLYYLLSEFPDVTAARFGYLKQESDYVSVNHSGNKMAATALGAGSVAIGVRATAETKDSIVIGSNSKVHANESEPDTHSALAIGDRSNAAGNYAAAIGAISLANGTGAVALGENAVATGNQEVISRQEYNELSPTKKKQYIEHVVIELKPKGEGGGTTEIIGLKYYKKGGDAYSLAVGTMAEASGRQAIALGFQAIASVEHAIAAGAGAEGTGGASVAVGPWAKSKGDSAVSLGAFANATVFSATALGRSSEASQKGGGRSRRKQYSGS